MKEQRADAIVFGALFVANPDLVARFKADKALNILDPASFYTADEKGYLDYPCLTSI